MGLGTILLKGVRLVFVKPRRRVLSVGNAIVEGSVPMKLVGKYRCAAETRRESRSRDDTEGHGMFQ